MKWSQMPNYVYFVCVMFMMMAMMQKTSRPPLSHTPSLPGHCLRSDPDPCRWPGRSSFPTPDSRPSQTQDRSLEEEQGDGDESSVWTRNCCTQNQAAHSANTINGFYIFIWLQSTIVKKHYWYKCKNTDWIVTAGNAQLSTMAAM